MAGRWRSSRPAGALVAGRRPAGESGWGGAVEGRRLRLAWGLAAGWSRVVDSWWATGEGFVGVGCGPGREELRRSCAGLH